MYKLSACLGGYSTFWTVSGDYRQLLMDVQVVLYMYSLVPRTHIQPHSQDTHTCTASFPGHTYMYSLVPRTHIHVQPRSQDTHTCTASFPGHTYMYSLVPRTHIHVQPRSQDTYTASFPGHTYMQ